MFDNFSNLELLLTLQVVATVVDVVYRIIRLYYERKRDKEGIKLRI